MGKVNTGTPDGYGAHTLANATGKQTWFLPPLMECTPPFLALQVDHGRPT